MSNHKIPVTQKSCTLVTSTQLTLLILLLGGAAGVCASVLLQMQDKLRGGLGFWYAAIGFGLALFAGIILVHLKFRLKAKKTLLPPRN